MLEDLELVTLPKLVRVVRVVKKVRVPTLSHSKVNFVCNDFALDSECSVLINYPWVSGNEFHPIWSKISGNFFLLVLTWSPLLFICFIGAFSSTPTPQTVEAEDATDYYLDDDF